MGFNWNDFAKVAMPVYGAHSLLADHLKGGKGETAEDFMNSNPGVKGLNAEAAAGPNPYMDPTTGTQLATQQVQGNPLNAGMWGDNSLQSRLLSEEKNLGSQGFQLQPEDREAYGQASGDIARMFGQEEQGLASSLAARGLAGSDNGAAAQGYSALAGNKSERLAMSQRKIADDRMKSTQQRLQAVRQTAMDNNQLSQSAGNDQFKRNAAGAAFRHQQYHDSADAGVQQQNQANAAFDQEQGTRPPGLGQILGTAAGAAAGGYAGGAEGAKLGASTGGQLGRAIR